MAMRICMTCGERFQIVRRNQRHRCRCAPGNTPRNRSRIARGVLAGRKFQPQVGNSLKVQSGLAGFPHDASSRGVLITQQLQSSAGAGPGLSESGSANSLGPLSPLESRVGASARPRQIGTKIAKIDGRFYPVRVFEAWPGAENEIILRTPSAWGVGRRRDGRPGLHACSVARRRLKQ